MEGTEIMECLECKQVIWMDYWEPLTNKRSENSQSANLLMKFL